MSIDFTRFDQLINKDELKAQMDAAPEFDDVPAGKYVVVIDKMEVKPTKQGDKLMLAVQMGITETIDAPKNQTNRKIFFNRVICGNKTTEKWNDGVAIKGIITWLEKLLDDGDSIEFESYSQFSDEVESIFTDICPEIAMEVSYDPEAFNPVTINEVFDN